MLRRFETSLQMSIPAVPPSSRQSGSVGRSDQLLHPAQKLAERNTSLRLLFREHRQTVIEARFGAGHCNFADLAQTLGYADATVFWRAFKSWSGTTPRDMRNQRGGTPRTRKNGPNG